MGNLSSTTIDMDITTNNNYLLGISTEDQQQSIKIRNNILFRIRQGMSNDIFIDKSIGIDQLYYIGSGGNGSVGGSQSGSSSSTTTDDNPQQQEQLDAQQPSSQQQEHCNDDDVLLTSGEEVISEINIGNNKSNTAISGVGILMIIIAGLMTIVFIAFAIIKRKRYNNAPYNKKH